MAAGSKIGDTIRLAGLDVDQLGIFSKILVELWYEAEGQTRFRWLWKGREIS